jgi:hypothetical protein
MSKFKGLILFSLLVIIYSVLGLFESDINPFFKTAPFIILSIIYYLTNKKARD